MYSRLPRCHKKYEYGYKYTDDLGFNVVGTKPEIHPLMHSEEYTFLSPGYILNDVENKQTQFKTKMFISLSIEKNIDGKLIAVTKLENKSNKSYFVHSIFLTLFKLKSSDNYSSSCRQDLLIVTNSTRLEYIGGKCHGYDDRFDSDEWVEIGPGKIYIMRINLDNNLYTFPSGNRMYSIGTLDYPFVDIQWFSLQRIYDSVFNILKWRYDYKIEQDENYLFLHNISFTSPPTIKDDFYKFMRTYISDRNIISKHQFTIRSKQILIEINGSALFPSKNNR